MLARGVAAVRCQPDRSHVAAAFQWVLRVLQGFWTEHCWCSNPVGCGAKLRCDVTAFLDFLALAASAEPAKVGNTKPAVVRPPAASATATINLRNERISYLHRSGRIAVAPVAWPDKSLLRMKRFAEDLRKRWEAPDFTAKYQAGLTPPHSRYRNPHRLAARQRTSAANLLPKHGSLADLILQGWGRRAYLKLSNLKAPNLK